MLGVTSVGSIVYLYFTEVDSEGEQLGNRIYKYDWNGEKLVNPVLLKELPSNEYHNSGAMVTGLDDQVYAVIGDTGKYGPLQNKPLEKLHPPETKDYMDTSVILRVDPEGPYHAMEFEIALVLQLIHSLEIYGLQKMGMMILMKLI